MVRKLVSKKSVPVSTIAALRGSMRTVHPPSVLAATLGGARGGESEGG